MYEPVTDALHARQRGYSTLEEFNETYPAKKMNIVLFGPALADALLSQIMSYCSILPDLQPGLPFPPPSINRMPFALAP